MPFTFMLTKIKAEEMDQDWSDGVEEDISITTYDH
jgi:hypothetical protein